MALLVDGASLDEFFQSATNYKKRFG